MAPPRRQQHEEPPSPHPPAFAAAISKVAVAQICRSVGYARFEAPALRALSDVAARYIAAVARSTAASANGRGRTESNLLDLVRAMEALALPVAGFGGGSDPTRPLLRSGLVSEVAAFVASVDEIPFPRPIRRPAEEEKRGRERPMAMPSFAQAGMDPPFPHVPRWLPRFPDSWVEDRGRSARVEERWGEEKSGGARRQGAAEDGMPAAVKFKFGSDAAAGRKSKRMLISWISDSAAAGERKKLRDERVIDAAASAG